MSLELVEFLGFGFFQERHCQVKPSMMLIRQCAGKYILHPQHISSLVMLVRGIQMMVSYCSREHKASVIISG